MAKQQEGYFTAEGVDVESRIEKRQTVFIENLQKAQAYADSRRSYKYEMFNLPTPGSRKLIGYGIPK